MRVVEFCYILFMICISHMPDIISKCCCTVLSVYGSSMLQYYFDPDGLEPSSNHIFGLRGHPRAEGGRPGGGAAVHSLFGTLIFGNLRILEQITFYLNGIFPLVTVFSISSDPVFICFHTLFHFRTKSCRQISILTCWSCFFSTSPSQPHLHSWKPSLVTLQLNFRCFTRETPVRRTTGFSPPKHRRSVNYVWWWPLLSAQYPGCLVQECDWGGCHKSTGDRRWVKRTRNDHILSFVIWRSVKWKMYDYRLVEVLVWLSCSA